LDCLAAECAIRSASSSSHHPSTVIETAAEPAGDIVRRYAQAAEQAQMQA
jgi:hypothetical protein